jgi:4-diphosphocytidyl-2-C-methyl-D-erythritol kinase
MDVNAFAKINLSLRVMGTRPDGYHELRTVFQSIALHDTLTIQRAPGRFALTCDVPGCPADRTNLVWRAAELVWRAAGRRGAPRDMSIHLTKRVPMRAGLGGGSSDGAAAIRALGRRWGVDDVRQRAIAAALGADVPFFFEGGTVLGLERGDLLFPLVDHPPAWVVLVVPRFGISTHDAFSWVDSRSERQSDVRRLENDLQVVVAERHPEIARIVRALHRSGATLAAMSGSGSAVFGLFTAKRSAALAAAALAGRARGMGQLGAVLVTRTLDRAAYRRLAAK